MRGIHRFIGGRARAAETLGPEENCINYMKTGRSLFFYFNEIDFLDFFTIAYKHPPPIHNRFLSYSLWRPSLWQSPKEMCSPVLILPVKFICCHIASLLSDIRFVIDVKFCYLKKYIPST